MFHGHFITLSFSMMWTTAPQPEMASLSIAFITAWTRAVIKLTTEKGSRAPAKCTQKAGLASSWAPTGSRTCPSAAPRRCRQPRSPLAQWCSQLGPEGRKWDPICNHSTPFSADHIADVGLEGDGVQPSYNRLHEEGTKAPLVQHVGDLMSNDGYRRTEETEINQKCL